VTCLSGWLPPPQSVIAANRAELVRFLRAVIAAPTDGTLTSWYRDPARNAACGGVGSSLHLRGLAIDVVPAAGQRLRARIAFQSTGLRVLDEGDHLHVSL